MYDLPALHVDSLAQILVIFPISVSQATGVGRDRGRQRLRGGAWHRAGHVGDRKVNDALPDVGWRIWRTMSLVTTWGARAPVTSTAPTTMSAVRTASATSAVCG